MSDSAQPPTSLRVARRRRLRLRSRTRDKRPSIAYVGRVLLVVFFLIMAAALGYYLYSLSLAASSRDWPAVPGTVEHSGIERGSHGRISTPAFRRLFRLEVEVVYQVNKRTYRCSRLSFSGSTLFRSQPEVEQLRATLSPGRVVPVYYDPTAPSRCVLLPG